jgi:hypothetical protein
LPGRCDATQRESGQNAEKISITLPSDMLRQLRDAVAGDAAL